MLLLATVGHSNIKISFRVLWKVLLCKNTWGINGNAWRGSNYSCQVDVQKLDPPGIGFNHFLISGSLEILRKPLWTMLFGILIFISQYWVIDIGPLSNIVLLIDSGQYLPVGGYWQTWVNSFVGYADCRLQVSRIFQIYCIWILRDMAGANRVNSGVGDSLIQDYAAAGLVAP